MKKALCIGINHYGIPNSDLNGCVNDISTLQGILTSRFGFATENITTLLNDKATTNNIKTELSKLVMGAVAGDTIVFQYSGHGSSIPDTSGDEIDKLDEIICPYDLNWTTNMVKDDDLYTVFKNVDPQVQLLVILDSCHSGSMLRLMNIPTKKSKYLVPKYIRPPYEVFEKMKSSIYDNDAAMASSIIRNRKKKESFNVRNGILLSGCQSNQTSADAFVDKKYQGAFTFALAKVLAQNNYSITYKDLAVKINALLDSLHYEQNPQLECPDCWSNKRFLG